MKSIISSYKFVGLFKKAVQQIYLCRAWNGTVRFIIGRGGEGAADLS